MRPDCECRQCLLAVQGWRGGDVHHFRFGLSQHRCCVGVRFAIGRALCDKRLPACLIDICDANDLREIFQIGDRSRVRRASSPRADNCCP